MFHGVGSLKSPWVKDHPVEGWPGRSGDRSSRRGGGRPVRVSGSPATDLRQPHISWLVANGHLATASPL